jgi:hypothetical protein
MKTFQEFITETSIRERTSMEEFEKLVHKFLPYVFKELKMKKKELPPIHFNHSKHNNGDGLHIKDIPGVTLVRSSEF